jgi:methylated-DNA-protein-cysteine methyltransferase-like protein
MPSVSRDFAESVYRIVCMVPEGQVTTYAQVGTYLGSPRLARPVGNALRQLSRARARDVPWQRVIKSDGTVAVRGDYTRAPRQVRMLRTEGVAVDEKWRVPLEIHGWRGPNKVPAVEAFPAPPMARARAGRRSKND